MEGLIIVGGLGVITIFVLGYKMGAEAEKTSAKQTIEILEKIILQNREMNEDDNWRRNYEG